MIDSDFSLSFDELRAIEIRVGGDALWSEWVTYVAFERRSPWLVVEARYRSDRPRHVPSRLIFSRHEETGEWVEDEDAQALPLTKQETP